MKIITQGTIPAAEPAPWWAGIKLTCGKCGTVVELEKGDPVNGTIERRPGGSRIVQAKCPVCADTITKHYTGEECARLTAAAAPAQA